MSQKRFLIALCLFLIGAFLFKTVFGLWVNQVQTRFGFRVAHRLSGDLWMHHFTDSLEHMRSKSSGRILEEINGWPILFARVFITGGQLYFNELVVMALLAVGLTAYNPLVFLGVAGIIGTGALLIRWLTKRRLQRNSTTIRALAPQATSLVSNAVRGFLELVTFRAVRSMQANYLSKTRRLYAVHSNQMVLGIAPARLYEFLAVTALCTVIIASLTFGSAGPTFFESLSLLALSAYRVMPAMARVNARMIAMRGQMHRTSSTRWKRAVAPTKMQFRNRNPPCLGASPWNSKGSPPATRGRTNRSSRRFTIALKPDNFRRLWGLPAQEKARWSA